MAKEIQWKPYDPSWLIALAKEQHPEEEWLPEALAACTKGKQKGEAYIYFIDAANPNQPESEWQFETNMTLHSLTGGFLILDILKGHRIGGIEFYEKLYKGPGLTCPCGFAHNYSSVVDNNWITILTKQYYKNFRKIEAQLTEPEIDKQTKRSLIKAKNALFGKIYQCPECGRIMWRKPGERTYQVFAPENT